MNNQRPSLRNNYLSVSSSSFLISEPTDMQQSKGRARGRPGHIPRPSTAFKIHEIQLMKHTSLGECDPDYLHYSRKDMSTSDRSFWEQRAEVEKVPDRVGQMHLAYQRENAELRGVTVRNSPRATP
ncbi:unnamed protein product [Rhizoctonia solani]|uniref:Uncharacterized protein n=1 Tax=Rhizoctonia solani TaxID=456999 RepID=A0A8H3G9A2_9AGAM|nr:unnamed protein product [Rhizoctonia solani]